MKVRYIMKRNIILKIWLLALIFSAFKIESASIELNNESNSILAGSPFYITSLYCLYKMINHRRRTTVYYDMDITPACYGAAGIISALSGALTSSLFIFALIVKIISHRITPSIRTK